MSNGSRKPKYGKSTVKHLMMVFLYILQKMGKRTMSGDRDFEKALDTVSNALRNQRFYSMTDTDVEEYIKIVRQALNDNLSARKTDASLKRRGISRHAIKKSTRQSNQ